MMVLGHMQLGPSALASPFTHTELPIELVSEQGVGQFPEVELAER